MAKAHQPPTVLEFGTRSSAGQSIGFLNQCDLSAICVPDPIAGVDPVTPPQQISSNQAAVVQIQPESKVKIFTYFVQGETGGNIKIGRTVDVAKRIKSLQTGCPLKLRLLLVLDGDQEYDYHFKFREYRLRGEWFKARPPLVDHINNLTDGCNNVWPARVDNSPMPETWKRPINYEMIEYV